MSTGVYGRLVRRARVSRGLTQAELAGVSGVEQSNISAIENDRRMPTAETLHRLLTACGYELVATAGDRALACSPIDDGWVGPDDASVLDEAPTITPDTPMDVRVRVLTEVLDLAEAIARAR